MKKEILDAVGKMKAIFANKEENKDKIDAMKKAAAYAALKYVEDDMIVGVGTGSTVDYFIEALGTVKGKIEGAVASSEATAAKLKAQGIPLIDLNSVHHLPLYVDGADEVDPYKRMIKGGGGALTREKIIANAADKFVCIVDETKYVDLLGSFPVPVEVIPLSRSFAAREIVRLGGEPVYREHFQTDNHHVILDVFNFNLLDPADIERKLNHITGVVENGLFVVRPADVLIIGTESGIKTL